MLAPLSDTGKQLVLSVMGGALIVFRCGWMDVISFWWFTQGHSGSAQKLGLHEVKQLSESWTSHLSHGSQMGLKETARAGWKTHFPLTVFSVRVSAHTDVCPFWQAGLVKASLLCLNSYFGSKPVWGLSLCEHLCLFEICSPKSSSGKGGNTGEAAMNSAIKQIIQVCTPIHPSLFLSEQWRNGEVHFYTKWKMKSHTYGQKKVPNS